MEDEERWRDAGGDRQRTWLGQSHNQEMEYRKEEKGTCSESDSVGDGLISAVELARTVLQKRSSPLTRTRRGRGEGGIYRRSDGTWCGSVSLGYDANGKRKRRVVYGDTKQEAQEKL